MTLPNKVTQDAITARIAKVDYLVRPNDTTLTICLLTCDNGIVVTGESACIDPAEFNAELGQRIAFKNAVDKLWFPMGFLLAEERMRAEQNKNPIGEGE